MGDVTMDRAAPATASDLLGLGARAVQGGQLSDALAAFSEAVREDSRSASAHWWRGVTLRALGRFDDASLDFLRATELVPEDPDYWQWAAIALGETGRTGESDLAFARSAALTPARCPTLPSA